VDPPLSDPPFWPTGTGDEPATIHAIDGTAWSTFGGFWGESEYFSTPIPLGPFPAVHSRSASRRRARRISCSGTRRWCSAGPWLLNIRVAGAAGAGAGEGLAVAVQARSASLGRTAARDVRLATTTRVRPSGSDPLLVPTDQGVTGVDGAGDAGPIACSYAFGVPAETSPRQAPLSVPRSSISSLNRSRSPRTRRSSRPAAEPSASSGPSAW